MLRLVVTLSPPCRCLVRSGGDFDEPDDAYLVPSVVEDDGDGDGEDPGGGAAAANRTRGAAAKRARDPEGNQREVRPTAIALYFFFL